MEGRNIDDRPGRQLPTTGDNFYSLHRTRLIPASSRKNIELFSIFDDFIAPGNNLQIIPVCQPEHSDPRVSPSVDDFFVLYFNFNLHPSET